MYRDLSGGSVDFCMSGIVPGTRCVVIFYPVLDSDCWFKSWMFEIYITNSLVLFNGVVGSPRNGTIVMDVHELDNFISTQIYPSDFIDHAQ